MHKAIRTRADNKGDAYSKRGGIDFTKSKDMARQEFKDETDINTILRNFGVNNQQRTMATFGEFDYTIDLQQALHSLHDTQRAYNRMDADITNIYPTFEKFLQGVRSGALEKDLERLELEKHPVRERAEIRAQINKERAREQLLRDDEADRIAKEHRENRAPSDRSQPSTKEDKSGK